jgi:hypothetical protein
MTSTQTLSRIETWLASALLFGVLLACKKKTESDPERPLPSIQVPVTTPPAPLTPPAKAKAKAEPEPEKPSTAPVVRRRVDAGATRATDNAGSASSADAAKPETATVDAGASAPTLGSNCLDKCQGILSKCLTAPKDGGLPGFGNTRECAEAFDGCRVACTGK